MNIKPAALEALLIKAFPAHKTVAIEGTPGGGKTQIIVGAAKKCGLELILDHPSISDPTDYKGLPIMRKDGSCHFAPIGLIKKLIGLTKHTVVFIDDLGQAPHAVQAALMQLIHGGKINDVELPEHLITWVIATNGVGDRAGVQAVLEPVKSRCWTLLTLEVDVTDWCRWAYQSGKIAEEVIAFIRFKPEHLNAFAPTREWKNSPCPRTVEYASDWFRMGITDKNVLAGACGEAWALDFLSFLRVYKDLPSIDALLLEPTQAIIPSTIGARWAVSSGLIKRASPENLSRIITYLKRLSTSANSRDFEVMTVKDILKTKPESCQWPGFSQWGIDNDDVMS